MVGLYTINAAEKAKKQILDFYHYVWDIEEKYMTLERLIKFAKSEPNLQYAFIIVSSSEHGTHKVFDNPGGIDIDSINPEIEITHIDVSLTKYDDDSCDVFVKYTESQTDMSINCEINKYGNYYKQVKVVKALESNRNRTIIDRYNNDVSIYRNDFVFMENKDIKVLGYNDFTRNYKPMSAFEVFLYKLFVEKRKEKKK